MLPCRSSNYEVMFDRKPSYGSGLSSDYYTAGTASASSSSRHEPMSAYDRYISDLTGKSVIVSRLLVSLSLKLNKLFPQEIKREILQHRNDFSRALTCACIPNFFLNVKYLEHNFLYWTLKSYHLSVCKNFNCWDSNKGKEKRRKL